MGTSTFAEYTVMPEIALAKVEPGGAARARVPVRVRALDRARRGDEHREGRARLDLRRLRRRHGRPRRGRRLPPAGRRADRLRRPLGGAARARDGPGRDRRRSSAGRTPSTRILELTGGFGADYTFEATGNVAVMRQAVESARMGWGLCTVAGVAGKGETLDVVPRFLITGRRVAGSSFGGVKGRDQVPQLVERCARRRDRRRAVRLAPAHARRRQPRLRADGGAGRHPQRDRVRLAAGSPGPSCPISASASPRAAGMIDA